MSRNASGTFTLDASNPVVAGTTVDPDWANNTLSDIATEMTDSLNRSGKGAMLAPLELANGAVGTPALSFDSDPDSGLYRIGANNLGVSVNGAKVLDVATTGLAVTGAFSATTSIAATTSVAATTTVTAGTGITSTTGNIVATAGDVQAGDTKDFKYGAAQTRYFMATADNFQPQDMSTGLQFFTSAGLMAWGSSTSNSRGFNGALRLPPGATITAIQIWLQNVSGGNINVGTPGCYLRTYGSSGDSVTSVDAGGTIAVADTFNGYKTVTLGAGPYAIPDDGTAILVVVPSLNQTAGADNHLRFYGVRVTYTVTKLRS